MCWPDFSAAAEVINIYKDIYLPEESPDAPEKKFKHRCHQLWAVQDLLNYLDTNWFVSSPVELICDYIEDAKFRSKKYAELYMGPVYRTAYETAEDILRECFVSEV